MRKSFLLSVLILFSSVLAFSQEQVEYVAEPTGKQARKQKREARKAEYEAKKQEALEMIKGGDFVLVATQLTFNSMQMQPENHANYVKIEGD